MADHSQSEKVPGPQGMWTLRGLPHRPWDLLPMSLVTVVTAIPKAPFRAETIFIHVDCGHASNTPFQGQIEVRVLSFRLSHPPWLTALHRTSLPQEALAPRPLLSTARWGGGFQSLRYKGYKANLLTHPPPICHSPLRMCYPHMLLVLPCLRSTERKCTSTTMSMY